MGCFDEVFMPCPACTGTILFQSKAGPCAMLRYDYREVPAAVAADISDGTCDECGRTFYADVPQSVSIRLRD